MRLRPDRGAGDAFADFADLLEKRRQEADVFYAETQKNVSDADARLVQRQALAGLLWSCLLYTSRCV